MELQLNRRSVTLLLAAFAGCLVMANVYARTGNGAGVWFELNQQFSEALRKGDLVLAEEIGRKRIDVADSLGNKRKETSKGIALRGLGMVMRSRGNLEEAEALFLKAQGMIETGKGKLSAPAIRNLKDTGLVLKATGRFAEAQKIMLDALARQEAYAPRSLDILMLYNLLADIASQLNRLDEAEKWLNKALKAEVETDAQDEGDEFYGDYWLNKRLAQTFHLYGKLELKRGHLDKAADYLRQSLDKFSLFSNPLHPDIIVTRITYGALLLRQGQEAEAERELQELLDTASRVLGGNHQQTAKAAFFLALSKAKSGKHEEADALFLRAVKIVKELNLLNRFAHYGQARVRFLNKRGRVLEALSLEKEVLDTVDSLFVQTHGLDDETREGFMAEFGAYYHESLAMMMRLNQVYPGKRYDREVLATVSRTQSRIFSELLRQVDAAALSRNDDFKELINRRARLDKSIRELRQRKIVASRKAYTDDETSGAQAVAKRVDDPIVQERIDNALILLSKEFQDAAREAASVESVLWEKYPRYMELTQPQPVTVDMLQKKLLKPNETLLTYFLLPDSTLAFVTSRDEYKVIQLPVTRDEVSSMVKEARGPEESVGADGLSALARLDPALLHKLYTSLFQPLESSIKDIRRLIVVADGPLFNLPLEMLVTRYGKAEKQAFAEARFARQAELAEYATLPYLGEQYRFAYLPSLSALASMRLYRKPQVKYEDNLVSFADPVFEKNSDVNPLLEVLTRGMRKNGALSIPRLPETANEAKDIANIVGGKTQIYLRDQAQEYTAKTIDLSRAKYIHFATHGLLSGEFVDVKGAYSVAESQIGEGGSQRSLKRVNAVADVDLALEDEISSKSTAKGEPALLLSLDGNMRGEDGLLTMSEILSKLDINAKLVVLSACNTAGEGVEHNNGEGFAGLTRSFMYAGAQGMLVSHWSVESQATQNLMTDTFRYLQARTDTLEAVDQARAKIRRSTTNINGKAVSRAHPYFWAPFVFVGD